MSISIAKKATHIVKTYIMEGLPAQYDPKRVVKGSLELHWNDGVLNKICFEQEQTYPRFDIGADQLKFIVNQLIDLQGLVIDNGHLRLGTRPE